MAVRRNPQVNIQDYESLKKEPLKRDGDRNIAYTNEVELLLCKGVEWMQTQFMDVGAEEGITLSPFIHTESRPVDPSIGGTLGMVGYTLPYEEHHPTFGEHLIARVHPEIPEIVMNTYNYFEIRNTYTIQRETKQLELPRPLVDEFYARQLAAFARSEKNWLRFLSYLIFADMTEQAVSHTEDNYPGKIDDSVKDHHFEVFKKTLFAPKAGPTQGFPWRDMNLVLEKVPIINPNYKVTKNEFLNHLIYLRKTLTTHIQTGNVKNLRFQHEIPDIAKEIIAFREKATDIAHEMYGNSIKYRLTNASADPNGFCVFTNPGDLILIMDERSETLLNETVPNFIKPNIFDFSAGAIGVSRIIKSRGFKRGEGMIIHKDALKMIITMNDIGSARYEEQYKTNRGHRLGYFLDVFKLFPCCYIKKEVVETS